MLLTLDTRHQLTKVKFKNTVNVKKAKKKVNVRDALAVGIETAMEEEAVVVDVAAMKQEDPKIVLILVTRTQNVAIQNKAMVMMEDKRTEEEEIAEVVEAVAKDQGKTSAIRKKSKMIGNQDQTLQAEEGAEIVAVVEEIAAVEDIAAVEVIAAVEEMKASEAEVEEAVAGVVTIKETAIQTTVVNVDSVVVGETVKEVVVNEDVDADVMKVKLCEITKASITTAIETKNLVSPFAT